MTAQAKTVELASLPETITDYLAAHIARDLDTAVASYTADATVIDEGHTYHGQDEIRAWLSRSASEYTYTSEIVEAVKIDQDRYDVTNHLEGNFPGGQADLRFRFTLLEGEISRLVIEP